MKLRSTLPLFVGLVAASCGGETADSGAEEATEMASVAEEMTPAEAALDEFTGEFAEYYNMHDAAAVANMYAEDAITLLADGTIATSRDQILANLENAMSSSPSLTLEPAARIVLDDHAVARGHFTVNTTAGEQAVEMGGNYLTVFTRGEDGGWQVQAVITNYDAPPPEGMPRGTTPGETPEDAGTMKEVTDFYATHFNMGHASMVADLFTDDGFLARPNAPAAEGRAAIEAALQAAIDQGVSNLVIHDVRTQELGEGWAADMGWHTADVATPDGTMSNAGTYISLLKQQEDGSWKLHWLVANGLPATDDM